MRRAPLHVQRACNAPCVLHCVRQHHATAVGWGAVSSLKHACSGSSSHRAAPASARSWPATHTPTHCRDIKPENTVFSKERVLKVTDFGLAINAGAERPVTRLGTLDYMAPEVRACVGRPAGGARAGAWGAALLLCPGRDGGLPWRALTHAADAATAASPTSHGAWTGLETHAAVAPAAPAALPCLILMRLTSPVRATCSTAAAATTNRACAAWRHGTPTPFPQVLRCPDKHDPEDNKEREDLEYNASVDAWAMGVLAFELIVGRPPFGMVRRGLAGPPGRGGGGKGGGDGLSCAAVLGGVS